MNCNTTHYRANSSSVPGDPNAVNIGDIPDAGDGPDYWYTATDQVIVTRNQKLLAWPRIDDVAEEIDDRANLPTFTDSHHNLLRILK